MTISFDENAAELAPESIHADGLAQLLDHWPKADPAWPGWLQEPRVLPFICKELEAIRSDCDSQRIVDGVARAWKSLNQQDWAGARVATAELAAMLLYGESLSDEEICLAATGTPGHSSDKGGSDGAN